MTSRQFCILLALLTISVKVQKLPCFMFEVLGKDSFVMFLFYMAVNVVGILMALFILKIKERREMLGLSESRFEFWLNKTINLFAIFYFIVQVLLLYEHIQDLFSNTLFDNMPWWIFSFLLLFAVFYLAHTGIKNIALGGELYFFAIVLSYLVIGVLSGVHTDFSNVLPFQTIDFHLISNNFIKFNSWFGDFFILLFLGSKTKKISVAKTLLTYCFSLIFVVYLVVCFNGIYLNHTALQSGLIAEITEQSMLGMNIGRIDWFLILITEIGVVLSCGAMFYFAVSSARKTMPKVKAIWIEILIALVVYYFDIFYFVDMHAKRNFFYGFVSYFSISLKIVGISLLFLTAVAWFFKIRKKSLKNNQKMGANTWKDFLKTMLRS